MSGENPRLSPLALRKQLLIAESELNRAQLAQEWHTMTGKAHALTRRVRSIGEIASTTASLVMGLLSFRPNQSVPVDKKLTWLQTLLKGAQWAGWLWSQFNPPPKS